MRMLQRRDAVGWVSTTCVQSELLSWTMVMMDANIPLQLSNVIATTIADSVGFIQPGMHRGVGKCPGCSTLR